MCWLQPQMLRHFTALRPERKVWSFSKVVWVIRNIEYLPVLFGGLEILNLPCCLGNQKFWILSSAQGCVIWAGYHKFWISWCCLGIRNSESPFLFRVSEILNLLCYLGYQKFWISCVVWGIRNSESPVLFGDQKFWIFCVLGGSEILNLLCCLGIRNSESPVLFGDQKIWISCVIWGIRNSESPVSFGGSEILNDNL